MSDFRNLEVNIKDRIALVTIRRPKVLNALDADTVDELEIVFGERLIHPDSAAVILTGSGKKSFVAGTDINELVGIDSQKAKIKSGRAQAVFKMIERFPKVVIAAINGYCLGGGCELALACQIRVAAKEAQLGFPEVKLGIIPGYGGTQRLSRLIGKSRAMEMILTGESITAQQAERVGLVNSVVDQKELLPECQRLANKISANAPLAVRYAIEAINDGLEMPLYDAIRMERTLFALSCATEDMKEGVKGFIEKRDPQFEGK